MKNLCNVMPIFLLCGPAAICAAQTPTQKSAISAADHVIRLFDGRTLGDCDVWLKDTKHEDPRQVFRVTDGLLHVTGDGLGGLITRDRYRNYHLVLEYKWGERTWHDREKAARDSGLLIHSNGKLGGYQGIWMPAIEVQIIEGGVGDFVPVPGPDEAGKPVILSLTANVGRDRDDEVVWKEDGARETFRTPKMRRINWFGRDPDWKDEKGIRGPQDKDSPQGEWTRIDVLSDEGHIQTFVNGVKVNEAFDASPREGRIQLQSELAEIFFRRWELWPLGKGPEIEAAK
jgi:3-keto-disaccharide hydrolase